MLRRVLLLVAVFACGCERSEPPHAFPLAEVKVLEIKPKNTPIVFNFVGQAESSRQVEIRARVDGFLDNVAYQEGDYVEPGEVMFVLDKKPFEAALQQAEGELALQQARLFTANANLQRVKPLAEMDAVSQKDLDDALGQEQAAKAAVLSAEGSVREARLNLSYTTIRSPLKGLASKTQQQEGSYIPRGPGSLLTYVARLDPIWVDFSVSENQILTVQEQEKKGLLILPKANDFEVEVVLADGKPFPNRGVINFAEPNIDPMTGTFFIRAELANPKGEMRPGQFVRVLLHGAIRPNAILVPQSAVFQGAKGNFVWVLGEDMKPKARSVVVGSWQGENWFIEEGLQEGEKVIVDGIMRLNPNLPVKVVK